VPDAGHFSALEADGPVDIETPILEESSHDATNGEMIQSAVKQSIEQLLAIAFGEVGSVKVGEEQEALAKGHVSIGHTVMALAQSHLPPAAVAAPAAAPKTLQGFAPAPAAAVPWAPGPSAPMLKAVEPEGIPALPKMSVTFLPGRHFEEEKFAPNTDSFASTVHLVGRATRRMRSRSSVKVHKGHGHHVESLTTIVEVHLVESPDVPKHDIDDVRKALAMYLMDGTLTAAVSAAIAQVVNMHPLVGVIEEATGSVSPYNVSACATHIHNLVDSFSRAYSRRQTIPALFHACTHFAQKESFSHDVIVDESDKKKCRAATKRFASMWQYGKGKVDYARFCLQICELRHGQDAMHCDAYKNFR